MLLILSLQTVMNGYQLTTWSPCDLLIASRDLRVLTMMHGEEGGSSNGFPPFASPVHSPHLRHGAPFATNGLPDKLAHVDFWPECLQTQDGFHNVLFERSEWVFWMGGKGNGVWGGCKWPTISLRCLMLVIISDRGMLLQALIRRPLGCDGFNDEEDKRKQSTAPLWFPLSCFTCESA